MEEDIFFAVMLSLVSRDPFFQIWWSRCWVSCAGAVFCFPIIKGWICFHANVNYHMKIRQESFKLFEKRPVSTACGHLGVDSDNIA